VIQLDIAAGVDLSDWWQPFELEAFSVDDDDPSPEDAATITPETARASLADRFVVPPFSVLDARQGYWQNRKRAWIALGIESELGRGVNLGTCRLPWPEFQTLRPSLLGTSSDGSYPVRPARSEPLRRTRAARTAYLPGLVSMPQLAPTPRREGRRVRRPSALMAGHSGATARGGRWL
jgi:hypothetical protein